MAFDTFIRLDKTPKVKGCVAVVPFDHKLNIAVGVNGAGERSVALQRNGSAAKQRGSDPLKSYVIYLAVSLSDGKEYEPGPEAALTDQVPCPPAAALHCWVVVSRLQ